VEVNLRADGSAQIGFIVGVNNQILIKKEEEVINKRLVDDWSSSLFDLINNDEDGATTSGSSTSTETTKEIPKKSYQEFLDEMNNMVTKVRENAIAEGFKTEDLPSAQYKGFKGLKDFANIEEISKMGSSLTGNNDISSLIIKKLGQGIVIKKEDGQKQIILDIDIEKELGIINQQMADISKNWNVKKEILETYTGELRFKVYKAPESHNATSVENEDKTLIWDLKKTSKIKMTIKDKDKTSAGGNIFLVIILVFIVIIVIGVMVIKHKKRNNAQNWNL
jgi:hypothetical protein